MYKYNQEKTNAGKYILDRRTDKNENKIFLKYCIRKNSDGIRFKVI
jgi:hypothetical protein